MRVTLDLSPVGGGGHREQGAEEYRRFGYRSEEAAGKYFFFPVVH